MVTRLVCTESRSSSFFGLGILLGAGGDLRALTEGGRSSSDVCVDVDVEAVCANVCVDFEAVCLGERYSGAISARK